MEQTDLYRDIANRTDSDIYIGVVGPVRTGKSTLITQFMEKLVLPRIDNARRRERTRDELPQSGSGRTIMTTQPKFVPGEAVNVQFSPNASANVRLVDCVGYLIKGAMGTQENDVPRMVKTPWSDSDMPFEDAAEIGTRKVIADHSTIGLVVTTDGSFTELPRSAYVEAEERVVRELQQLGKPFVVILNVSDPASPESGELQRALSDKYGVPVLSKNVKEMELGDIQDVLRQVLYEFPVSEVRVNLPAWALALDDSHWLMQELMTKAREAAQPAMCVRESEAFSHAFDDSAYTLPASQSRIDLGSGEVAYSLPLRDGLFNRILGEHCGTDIRSDAHLLRLMKELVEAKREYDHVAQALASVRETGYGLVAPSMEELTLSEPEIVKQGNHFGVKLKASAPSLHMIRVDIETEVSPIVGTEQQSEELVQYLLSGFEQDPAKIWSTNMFGKSLDDLMREGLSTKLMRMPPDVQEKVQQTLSRIINEGTGGMICILL
ncbi:stage IV sporulation protein A [Beduinella massiliensis]|uniref:stage IV sporulation protein A n=1 Tax=Beduinella massiliensis TaxID=1852363 RepID=UPI000C8315D4